ncbi:MAG: rRNA maturation RNase YbeY [Candidatus Dojkabacteria bacterium]|nr:rRNA maturation RNase YbeY [Candidatus Dojkabacteria bacterium]
MKLEILNTPKELLSQKTLSKSITKIFNGYNISTVNVIFVKNDEIKELNKQYRKKDYVTDVLSFNIDSEDLLGELYIASDYVIETIGIEKYTEEIVRLIIHGTLHLLGYEHTDEMFNIQEEMVQHVLRDIK